MKNAPHTYCHIGLPLLIVLAASIWLWPYVSADQPNTTCHGLHCQETGKRNFTRLVNNNHHMFITNHTAKRYLNTADAETRQLWTPTIKQLHANTKRHIQKRAQHQSCAVVANGAKLSDSNHGKHIDSHDAVFRLTLGKVRGHEADVGRRTTYRLQWYQRTVNEPDKPIYLLYQENAHINLPKRFHHWLSILAAYHQKLPKKLRKALHKKMGATYKGHPPKGRFLAVDNAFIEDARRQWQGGGHYKFMNSGEMGITMALHMCKQVHVYGFSTKPTDSLCYYYKRGPHTCRLKKRPNIFTQQMKFLANLEAADLITIHE